MISAKEVRNLNKKVSDNKASFEVIEKKITKAAKKGENSIIISVDSFDFGNKPDVRYIVSELFKIGYEVEEIVCDKKEERDSGFSVDWVTVKYPCLKISWGDKL